MARDHEVHVVTGFPTYPKGEIFDGYQNRFYQRESLGGMTVHRGAVYPSHDNRAVHRAANYLSFAAMGSLTAFRTPRDLDVGPRLLVSGHRGRSRAHGPRHATPALRCRTCRTCGPTA